MSYDIHITDPNTGEPLHTAQPHHLYGGTYSPDTTELWYNITYNYAPFYYRAETLGESTAVWRDTGKGYQEQVHPEKGGSQGWPTSPSPKPASASCVPSSTCGTNRWTYTASHTKTTPKCQPQTTGHPPKPTPAEPLSTSSSSSASHQTTPKSKSAKTMNDLPILDTEEKLRAYLNNIAGCEVDPLTIRAHIFPDRVHLDINSDPGIHIAFAQSSPSWMHVISYGIVDRAVLPVLKELHACHDREIQEAAQKRWEDEARREAKEADRRAQCLEKEIAYHQRELEKQNPSLLTRILNLFK